MVALKRAVGLFLCFLRRQRSEVRDHLFGRSVFGDGFGAFRHGVFGQFSREKKSNGGLDLP